MRAKCLACRKPMISSKPREYNRTRENNLCKDCYSITTTCACGCGRKFPLYNYQGKVRLYYQGSCYYNVNDIRECSRIKQSKAMKDRWKDDQYRASITGKNHPGWKGGKWSYPKEYSNELKESIKKRDNYTCQNIDCPHVGDCIEMHVHHIDFSKTNNAPSNLITLCGHCHHSLHFSIKNKRGKMLTFNGETNNIAEWSRQTRVPLSTILNRLRLGYPIERVLSRVGCLH